MAKKTMDFINEAENTMEGFEDVNSQTMAIPFIKLAQDLTPQVKKTKPEYIEGLDVGQFFNSVTGDIYGSTFDVIIVKFERIYIEWLPDRGGFVGYHSPEVAESMAQDHTFGKWKTADGNDLVEYYAYYVLISGREEEGPLIMSLTSTAIKTAKMLNRMMTTHMMDMGDGKPRMRAKPYYLVYTVEAVAMSKGPNDFYGYKFVFKDYITKTQDLLITTERKALPAKTVDYALLESGTGEGTSEKETDF